MSVMDHAEWQAVRMLSLTAPDGWLNLTDRVEIPPGPQKLGSAPDNDLVLSTGPAHLGVLTATATEASLEMDGQTLAFTAQGGNPMLSLPGLLLELHTVAGQPALRVRNTSRRLALNLFCYPFDPAWVITARWEALATPETREVDQKGAGPTEVSLTHRAHFSHGGVEVTLLATHWKAGKPMFVIRDATSGVTTYAASRFLIGEPQGDTILLDFNRAHNPPCAFTDFAICPLPPPENCLPFPIRAGERKAG
jgi:uncharacterized protein (DUF1684 family)